MRGRHLLRGTSNPTLCIFCASRFLGRELQPRRSFVPSRRYLNTSRSSGQSAAAAAQTQPEHTGDGSGTTATSEEWTNYSSLTPAERAEKNRRMQQRRAEEEAAAEEGRRRQEAMRAIEQQREQRKIGEMKEREEVVRMERLQETQRRQNATREAEAEQQRRHRDGMERQRAQAAEREESRHLFGDQRTTSPSHVPKKPSLAMPAFGSSSALQSSTTSPWQQTGDVQSLQYRSEDDTDLPWQTREADVMNEGENQELGERRWRGLDDQEPQGPISNLINYHTKRDAADTFRPRQPPPPPPPGGRGKGELFYRMRGSAYGEREPPRSMTNFNNADDEYRAVMFDNGYDHQSSQPRTSEEQEGGDWQHLKRRNSEPQPPPPPAVYQQGQSRRNNNSDDWIDRNFAEHRKQRRQYPQQQPYNRAATAPALAPEFTSRPSQTPVRCARCQEEGHVARECTGAVVCRSCGQKGHVAKACPQRSDPRDMDNPFAQPGRSMTRRTPSTPGRFNPFERPESESRAAAFPFERQESGRQATANPFDRRESEGRPPVSQHLEERVPSERQRWEAPAEEKVDERRASRSRRGFDEEDSALDEREERRPRRQGRRSVEVEDDEKADEAASLREERAARKSARKAAKKAQKIENSVPVNLPDFISVSNLAQTLNVRYENLLSQLEELGYDDVFPGKILNAETSGMIAMEYNFEPVFEEASAEKQEEEERDLKARPEVEDKTYLPTRPPVVTIMGHVDHGKTTILDYLRKSSVAAGEAGGITQHIGAFSVPLSASGKTITFLDTPGHAAFLAMRQRGANVTDIVILVVAADDSVKPQTLESLRCAREAKVPILVAINKVDKEEADVQRVKQDLARNGVEIEDFGGDTQVVCVSGKTGVGMEELEEAAVTLSEILDHRAEADGNVEGWVLEATTKNSGRVATVLVKRGTLRPGTVIVAGKTWARVRTLKNEGGQVVQEVGPGMPVEVDGWRDQPVAGDEVLQASGEQKAVDVVDFRVEKEERLRTAQDMEAINEARKLEQEKRRAEAAKAKATDGAPTTPAEVPEQGAQEPGQMTVPFIIKADVSGSAEAVSAYVLSLASPLIAPQILQSSVGAVHESDIELASAAQGHIIAFNLPSNADATASAAAEGVRVLENNIIYRVLDDVKAVLEEKLPPVVSQRVLGEAEVSAIFDIKLGGKKKMWIAGCKVRNGVIGKGSRVRVMRGMEKVYDGTINSLKNVKKDVLEMRKGTECGMGFEEWEGFETGDLVQTYEEISEKRKL